MKDLNIQHALKNADIATDLSNLAEKSFAREVLLFDHRGDKFAWAYNSDVHLNEKASKYLAEESIKGFSRLMRDNKRIFHTEKIEDLYELDIFFGPLGVIGILVFSDSSRSPHYDFYLLSTKDNLYKIASEYINEKLESSSFYIKLLKGDSLSGFLKQDTLDLLKSAYRNLIELEEIFLGDVIMPPEEFYEHYFIKFKSSLESLIEVARSENELFFERVRTYCTEFFEIDRNCLCYEHVKTLKVGLFQLID